MKTSIRHSLAVLSAIVLLVAPASRAQRPMEYLDRGVVAVRTGSSSVFVSWRLLGLDPSGTGFNLYRSANGGAAVKVNGSVLTQGTNFTDTNANLSKENQYFVKPMIGGIEGEASGSFTLPANTATEPCVVIPLKNGAEIHFAWVGDLDGDGEYDFVVDRLQWGSSFKIEAYKRDGTFLWEVDYGPNSLNQNNIEGGSSVIDVGHWDGVTVYDINNDGRAEVITKIADGVTLGDGSTWTAANDNHQWLAVLDGMTGALMTSAPIPQDFIAHGPLMAQLGMGWDGSQNILFAQMKNRQDNGWFNRMVCAYYLDGQELALKWKYTGPGGAEGHQIRVCDVNEDGVDDLCHIGYVLSGVDGSLLWRLDGVVHGDRWHIGKFDPNRSGFQGWGVQQNNPSALTEFYFDASTGQMLWEHNTGVYDVGRGDCADVDPNYPGYEAWSFEGMYNAPANTLIPGDTPWPVLRLWWDGDLLAESYNDGKIEQWNYNGGGVSRLVSTWNYHGATRSDRGAPMFYGDIFGDWREEVVATSSDYSQLVIFTSPHPTATRLYTLPHNPYYRNDMTVKGYMQSHHVDYYLGHGMTTPPRPDITYVQLQPPPDIPMELQASAAVTNQVDLSWSASTNATGYNVKRSLTPGGPYKLIASEIPATNYADTGLSGGTAYYYVVSAVNMSESANSSEVYVLATGLPRPISSVAYYRFEEGAAGIPLPPGIDAAVDSDGGDDNMNSADPETTPQYHTAIPEAVIPQTGQTNTLSTYYAGDDNLYNNISGPMVTRLYTDFSAEAYVRFASLSGFQTILGREDDEGDADGGVDGDDRALFYLSKHYDGHFRVEASTVGGDIINVEGSVSPELNTWYHLAAVGDASEGTLTLYVDGVPAGSTTGFDGLYPTTTHAWTIGRGMYDGNPVDSVSGYIDEVRVTASALLPNRFLNAFNPDTDGDGLNDTWEMTHFGNLNLNGADDPDSDGDNNETEETKGTPPTISSIPPTIDISFDTEQLNLNWPSNHMGWRLEYSTNLITGPWMDIPNSHTNNGYEFNAEPPAGGGSYFRLTYP